LEKYNFVIFHRPNPLWVLAKGFVTSIRTTFIFKTSQSELFIKSYDCLKFFVLNFWNSTSMINLYNLRTLPSNIH